MVILSGWGVYPVSPRESDEHTAFLDIVCQIFEQILYKRPLLENLTNTLQVWKELNFVLHNVFKNLKVLRGNDEH